MASDWATRSTAAGVLRAFRFDSNVDLGPNIEAGIQDWGWGNHDGRQDFPPRIDPTMSCEGSAGALLFSLPNGSYASCGEWRCRYTNSNVQTFGENTTHYIQFRYRMNAVVMNTAYVANVDTGELQGGIKSFGIVQADGSTSDDLKLIASTYYNSRWPFFYQGPTSRGMQVSSGSSDYIMQNAVPLCLYSNGAGCKTPLADDWSTMKIMVQLFDRVPTNENFVDVHMKAWFANDGEPLELMYDWSPSSAGYFPFYIGPLANHWKYGMFTFFPYMTNKDPRQVTDFGKVHYANLIISTQDIDDPPMVSAPPAPDPVSGRRSRVKVT